MGLENELLLFIRTPNNNVRHQTLTTIKCPHFRSNALNFGVPSDFIHHQPFCQAPIYSINNYYTTYTFLRCINK